MAKVRDGPILVRRGVDDHDSDDDVYVLSACSCPPPVLFCTTAIISRQFVEMQRSRIEGLLASFPKLIGGSKQHTFVETDAVRYVYQPIEQLYIVLLTTKASNILEDLETLRLFARLVPEYCRSLTQQDVLLNAFDLISAFDEVIALGYRESVNVSQIRTFTDMDSHEEKIFLMVQKVRPRRSRGRCCRAMLTDCSAQNKEREAKEAAKRRMKELERDKRDTFRSAGGPTGFGSSNYADHGVGAGPHMAGNSGFGGAGPMGGGSGAGGMSSAGGGGGGYQASADQMASSNRCVVVCGVCMHTRALTEERMRTGALHPPVHSEAPSLRARGCASAAPNPRVTLCCSSSHPRARLSLLCHGHPLRPGLPLRLLLPAMCRRAVWRAKRSRVLLQPKGEREAALYQVCSHRHGAAYTLRSKRPLSWLRIEMEACKISRSRAR
jgi:uncharacterized membrane protein YgcG